MRAAASAFAHAGFATLTFDYRGFGLSSGHPRQVLDLAGQRDDIKAAIDFLRIDRRIARRHIALWGTSLGGAHVVVVAAERTEVAAVVAQVPFNGFPRSVEGRSARGTLRLLAAMSNDRVRGYLGLRPRYIPVAGPPGSLAVMATADAERTIESLDSQTWRNEIAPRVLFDMMSYHPDRFSADVSAPILVCVASYDDETPETSARRIADRASDASLVSYPLSHFDIYRPGIRDGVIADQVAFLKEVMSRGAR